MCNSDNDESPIYVKEKSKDEDIDSSYIRVSSVLSPWRDFGAIDPEVLEKARARGDLVHHYCEMYANMYKSHATYLFEFDSVPAECWPYVESYILWFDENIGEVIDQEHRIYCPEHNFCGKPDQILRFKEDPDEVLTVVDIKTPQLKNLSWDLQTAAYQYLLNRYMPHVKCARRGSLMLKKDGKIGKFIEYTEQKRINMFLNALELYKFFNPPKKKKAK